MFVIVLMPYANAMLMPNVQIIKSSKIKQLHTLQIAQWVSLHSPKHAVIVKLHDIAGIMSWVFKEPHRQNLDAFLTS